MNLFVILFVGVNGVVFVLSVGACVFENFFLFFMIVVLFIM